MAGRTASLVSRQRRLFVFEARRQSAQVNDRPLVCPTADLFDIVPCGDREPDMAALNPDHLCFGPHAMANRGWCQMAYVNLGADGGFSRIEEVAHGIQGRILHGQDHHRSCEYRRQDAVLELARQVLRPYDYQEATLRAQENVLHLNSPAACPRSMLAGVTATKRILYAKSRSGEELR